MLAAQAQQVGETRGRVQRWFIPGKAFESRSMVCEDNTSRSQQSQFLLVERDTVGSRSRARCELSPTTPQHHCYYYTTTAICASTVGSTVVGNDYGEGDDANIATRVTMIVI